MKFPVLPFAAAAALFIGQNARAEGPPYAPAYEEAVTLTGWLHVEELGFEKASVRLEVNGETLSVPISESGRIDVSLPSGVEAVLRFDHPGHVTKEVVVDTRFAKVGDPGKHLRHVKFAVILEKDYFHDGLAYAGPVGNIGFDAQGGCLAIEHNSKRLVVGRKNQPMVF